MIKNQKGITLIALVITIIVLLILAGVSIAMLTGDNGILTNSEKAKLEQMEKEATEKINLALNSIKTELLAKNAENSTYTPVIGDFTTSAVTGITSGSDGYKVTPNGNVITITFATTEYQKLYKKVKSTDNMTVEGSIDISSGTGAITKATTKAGAAVGE